MSNVMLISLWHSIRVRIDHVSKTTFTKCQSLATRWHCNITRTSTPPWLLNRSTWLHCSGLFSLAVLHLHIAAVTHATRWQQRQSDPSLDPSRSSGLSGRAELMAPLPLSQPWPTPAQFSAWPTPLLTLHILQCQASLPVSTKMLPPWKTHTL